MPQKIVRQPTTPRTFAVGDYVRIGNAPSAKTAEIIEDRGHVGWQGRHIVRVRTWDENLDEQSCFEVEMDDLVPDPGPKAVAEKAPARKPRPVAGPAGRRPRKTTAAAAG